MIDEWYLTDGIYPGDEGHKRIAAAVGKYLFAAKCDSLHTLALSALEEFENKDRGQAEDGVGDENRDDETDLDVGRTDDGGGPSWPVTDENNNNNDDHDAASPTTRPWAGRPTSERPLYRRSARAPAV